MLLGVLAAGTTPGAELPLLPANPANGNASEVTVDTASPPQNLVALSNCTPLPWRPCLGNDAPNPARAETADAAHEADASDTADVAETEPDRRVPWTKLKYAARGNYHADEPSCQAEIKSRESRLAQEELKGTGPLPDPTGMLGDMSLDELAALMGVGKDSTIAVVGSSGRLLGSGLGAEIDAHTTVIRMNGAPAGQGYERSVGSRTPVRFAWSVGLEEAAERDAITEKQLVIVSSPDVTDREVLTRRYARLGKGVQVAMVPFAWEDKLQRHSMGGVGQRTSTGTVAVAMAVLLARHVGAHPPDVYGFGACLGCGRYYDCDGSNSTGHGTLDDEDDAERKGEEGQMHAFAAEERLRELWQSAGYLQLH